MAYLYLFLGIISEIFGTTMLKASDGFTKVLPILGAIFGFGFALFFLALSFKTIPLSVAYATWCGVGIAGASIISMIIWKEKLNLPGIIGMALIVIGIVLLNVTAQPNQTSEKSLHKQHQMTIQ
ncbi:DMT family transporter [Salirhabdus salicampi]|uniref:DMT family transporter n=1 Tax=Salirhabdus salicampi TaxID=476102 RepID=UPI0020C34A22|nr:multidrug efflux SMR transporter [Salirhabdus salicampi]MCP8615410.1 multidrug efflux SMR transporter [Salirhabdus salicampi]